MALEFLLYVTIVGKSSCLCWYSHIILWIYSHVILTVRLRNWIFAKQWLLKTTLFWREKALKLKLLSLNSQKFPLEQENYDTCIFFYTFRSKFLKFSGISKVVMPSIIYWLHFLFKEWPIQGTAVLNLWGRQLSTVRIWEEVQAQLEDKVYFGKKMSVGR